MSEQELEAEVVSATDDVETNETGETTETPDNSSRNKSNFKKLSQKLKDAETRAERAERLAQEKQEMLEAWESENPDIISKKYSKSDGIDKGDLALFLVQNPDAKDHLDEVREYMADMKNPDIDKAWKYVKPTISKESETKHDFDVKSKVKSQKLDLQKMSFSDYAKLDPVEYAHERKEWRKLHPEE